MATPGISDPTATTLLVNKLIPASPFEIVKFVAENMEDVRDSAAVRTDLQSQIDQILNQINYIAISINLFTGTPAVAQMGSTQSVQLSWSLNKDPSAQFINNSAININDSNRLITGVTTNQSYTLKVVDENNAEDESTVNISFQNRRYWGASINPSLDSEGVTTLTNELNGSRSKTITYNATGGRYIYYAYPSRLGNLSLVTVNGLAFSAYTVTLVNITNSDGYTESYNLIRFNSIQNGSAIQVSFV